MTSAAPTSGTDWVETRRLGWPPREFVGRERRREADTLLITSLRWALEELESVVADARKVYTGVDQETRRQVDAALQLLEVLPVAGAEPIMPSKPDLRGVRAEGRPWTAFAPVAEELLDLTDASILQLAGRLIVPDKDLAGSLFHLAVFGELLRVLRHLGAETVPLRPLSGAASPGPSYRVRDGSDRLWDLWFEAAGVWSIYGEKAPYAEASIGVPGSGTAVGADILLVRRPEVALIVECKYSAEPTRVARNGYHQAMAYAVEAERLAGDVTSVVVGPSDVVTQAGFASMSIGKVGIVPPEAFGELLQGAGI